MKKAKLKVKETKKPLTIIKYYSLVLILLAGLLSYSNTFYGPFIFDDILQIAWREEVHLHDFSSSSLNNLWEIIKRKGRPVVQCSLALNYYFGKLNTYGFHLVNLITHLTCAVLVYLFLHLTLNLPLFRNRYRKQARKIALVSGLLFVVHPVQTQAVSYIIQRAASMAALFFLLTVYCYAKARLANRKKRTVFFIAAALAGLLALGCKQNTVTLPFFLVFYEYYFRRKPKSEQVSGTWLYTAAGIFLLSILLVGVYTGFDPTGWLNKGYQSRTFTPGERMLTQLRVLPFYLGLLLFPLPSRLNLDHHFPLSYSIFDPATTLIGLVLLLGLVGCTLYLAKKRPLISFALLWFWGNLVLESSFIPLELVYEHRLYLPSVGFFLLVAVFLVKGIEKLKTLSWIKAGLLFVLIFPLGLSTYERNQVWQNELALWEDAAGKSPKKTRTHYNLANAYAQRQNYAKAMPYFLKTIQLQPDHAKAHNNLGYCYFFKGNIQEAIIETKTALKYDDKLVDGYFNLGIYYWNLGKPSSAREEFKKALKLKPDYQKALVSLRELNMKK